MRTATNQLLENNDDLGIAYYYPSPLNKSAN
jgi:hypothetical protein